MIVLIAAVALAGQSDRVADWLCATPLIQKNYSQPIEAKDLALRITDECARPYEAPDDQTYALSEAYRVQDKTIYSLEQQTFTHDVQTEIERRRRANAIHLRR